MSTAGAGAWDARYAAAAASADTVWSLEPNAWIAATVRALTPATALGRASPGPGTAPGPPTPPGQPTAVDLGAGEGRNALWLASLGWHVTALDFSAIGLATGAARAAELGLTVEWVTADATTWVSPQPVDLVVAAYLQLPAAQLARALGNAATMLSPGGILAVIGHDLDNLTRGVGGPQDAAVLHTVDALRSAASGLEVLECRQLERVTAAGIALDTILIARAPQGT